MRYSKRLLKIPIYPFVELENIKSELIKKKIDVISFAIGDPDLSPPRHVVHMMKRFLDKPELHRYPLGSGLSKLKQAIANWYRRRFNVKLNPENEVLVLIGSKEGIAHLPLAFINKGEYALVPDPCYPVYWRSVIFADGIPYFLPLNEKNGFLPELDSVPKKILRKSKLLFINYPNNPTAAVATEEFFKHVVHFAQKNNIIVIHDSAYSEIYFDEKPMSFLSVDGAKDVGVEFHSLSKTYSMQGWRIGWVCGNAEVIKALTQVKENYDSGVFHAIQCAAVSALDGDQSYVEKIRKIYKRRRDIMVNALNHIGWEVNLPRATFYIWMKVPIRNKTSNDFCKILLKKTAILLTPGSSFGKYGDGYVRLSLTLPDERIFEAIDRLKKVKWQMYS